MQHTQSAAIDICLNGRGLPMVLFLLSFATVLFTIVVFRLLTFSIMPSLFEAAADNSLGVYAADSIGAAIGSMVSFFIPIVFGFDWFFALATVTFWATAVVTYLFFRNSVYTERN